MNSSSHSLGLPSTTMKRIRAIPAWIWFLSAVSGLVPLMLALREDITPDEINRWVLSRQSIPEIFALAPNRTGGNELYLLILHAAGSLMPSPRFWRILGVGGHAVTVPLAYVLFEKWFGRKVAAFVALWIAISPLHIYEAYDLKEYSLAVPLALIVAHLSFFSIPTSLRRAFWIGCLEWVGSSLTLSLSSFWLSVAIAQVLDPQRRGGRLFGKLALQHLPAAGLTVATLLRWNDEYRPVFFDRDATILRNDPLKILGDFFAYVDAWLWFPPAIEPAACVAPPPAWFSGAMQVLPWMTGGVLLLFCVRSLLDRGERVDGRNSTTAFRLVFGHMVLYWLVFLMLGHPHFYMSRLYLASSPFAYALVGSAWFQFGRWTGLILSAPTVAVALLSLFLLLNGSHPTQQPRIRPFMESIGSGPDQDSRIYVYPGLAYPYVAYHSPATVRDRLQPVGRDIVHEPLGWAVSLAPLDPQAIESFRQEVGSGSRAWLVILPEMLIFRDPELRLLAESGRQWSERVCLSNLMVYQTR